MTFEFIHSGYYMAEDSVSGDTFVVRTRPKNDGWMAIDEEEGIVLATGLSLLDAKETCESYDRHVAPTFVTAGPQDPVLAMGDTDEQFESLIASYHTR
jgi:hypothetical protein